MINKKICTRCILDSEIQEIKFDESGICNFCKIHELLEKQYPIGIKGEQRLSEISKKIKFAGKGKEYDCIVGVSGGRDSTYTLFMVKKLGLRPLAVHFDNGWNSPAAVSNIMEATGRLGVDLHTVVADWEEFRDLQLSFLRASVPDADIPTDWAIYSVLYHEASKRGIKYVIQGHAFRTEGTSPISWTYMDGKYIQSVHKRFGSGRISSFPVMGLPELLYHLFIEHIREVRILEYLVYNHKNVDKILKQELNWKYYGGHHHESVYTKFLQSYYLPHKFGIDKRKLELAALVRSGQLKREEAIMLIAEPYPYEPEVLDYVQSKLEISDIEFEEILNAKPKKFSDYPTYYPLLQVLHIPVRIACMFHILPPIVSQKYLNAI